jgi:hypothetical protein
VNEVTLTQSADAVARPDTVTWLIQSQDNDPTFPLDPELDAAARPMDAGGVNPMIVRSLTSALRSEIRLAIRRVRRGAGLDKVDSSGSQSDSLLGCYFTGHRAGRRAPADRV